jgi:hypothetical protein
LSTEETMTDSMPPIGLGAEAEAEAADAAEDADAPDPGIPEDKTDEEARVDEENDLA